MKNKKGFTLSEVMVTLGVLGVIAAILIPAVTKVTPDANKIMLRKAYFTTEKVVNSLISDDSIYPIGTLTADSDGVMVSKGFNNTDTTNMGVPVGNDKFCYLFTQRINTTSANCTAATVGGVPAYTFTTSDGIVWTYTVSAFALNPTAYTTVNVLAVDVNGTGKGDNCFYNTCTGTKKADSYRFRIRYDGKMTIDSADTVAVGYLTSPTDNKK